MLDIVVPIGVVALGLAAVKLDSMHLSRRLHRRLKDWPKPVEPHTVKIIARYTMVGDGPPPYDWSRDDPFRRWL